MALVAGCGLTESSSNDERDAAPEESSALDSDEALEAAEKEDTPTEGLPDEWIVERDLMLAQLEGSPNFTDEQVRCVAEESDGLRLTREMVDDGELWEVMVPVMIECGVEVCTGGGLDCLQSDEEEPSGPSGDCSDPVEDGCAGA
jgi:hypothetical protein